MALSLDIQPARAAGSFRLGMPIGETIQHLQKHSRAIRRVELLFDEASPLARDITLLLPQEGIVLYFDPLSQRLHLVEIVDLGRLLLSYAGNQFSSPSCPPTFVRIYQLFGPTYPGVYRGADHSYTLNYPGLSFRFHIPPEFAELFADEYMPLELPNGTTPVACRIQLYHGRAADARALPPVAPPSLYWEPVAAHVGTGAWFPRRRAWIRFGESPQDVTAVLGTPDSVYYKDHDRLRIHSLADRPVSPVLIDYFYNYFAKGLDVMFDGTSHRVKKLIFHTNCPCSADFNTYAKPNFTIVLPAAAAAAGGGGPSAPLGAPPADPCPVEEEGEAALAAGPGGPRPTVLDPNATWGELQAALGPCSTPLVNDHTSSNSPFGGTRFFSCLAHRLILEVMKNNHIASVNLFH